MVLLINKILISINQLSILLYQKKNGLVHASYSLPQGQAVELTRFAPCFLASYIDW